MNSYFQNLQKSLSPAEGFESIRYISGVFLQSEAEFLSHLSELENRYQFLLSRELVPLYHDLGMYNGGLLDAEYYEVVVHSCGGWVATMTSVFEVVSDTDRSNNLDWNLAKYQSLLEHKLTPFAQCLLFPEFADEYPVLLCESDAAIFLTDLHGEVIEKIADSIKDFESGLQLASLFAE